MFILKVLNGITGQTIPTEPRVILLGDTSMLKVNKNHIKFIRTALITVNKCIAMHWKDASPPTLARWTNEIALCIPSEKIMCNLKGKPGEFQELWGGFLTCECRIHNRVILLYLYKPEASMPGDC